MKNYVTVLTGLFTLAALAMPVMAEDYLATIVEDDNVQFAISEIDPEGDWGYTIKADLANKTDKEAMFTIQDAFINGLVVDPFWATTVEANAEKSVEIEWNKDTFEEYGIDEVTEIKLVVRIYEDEDYSNVYYEDTFVYCPLGEDAVQYYVREAQDTDQILFENDDIAITLIGNEINEWDEFELKLYLENKTDGEIMDSVESAVLNGKDIDPYWATSIPAHASKYAEISWYSSELEEQGIDQIETIRLELQANDENWDELMHETMELNIAGDEAAVAETEVSETETAEPETVDSEAESEEIKAEHTATDPVDLEKFAGDIIGALIK